MPEHHMGDNQPGGTVESAGKIAGNCETTPALLEAFEALTLPPAQFHHVEHVRLAWSYLQHYPLCEAIERFVTGLQRFAAAHGQAERYHATVTWAYILLINERLAKQPSGNGGSSDEDNSNGDSNNGDSSNGDGGNWRSNWHSFAAANPDLLSWQDNVLRRYYHETTLQSALARQVFVLPDKLALT